MVNDLEWLGILISLFVNFVNLSAATNFYGFDIRQFTRLLRNSSNSQMLQLELNMTFCKSIADAPVFKIPQYIT